MSERERLGRRVEQMHGLGRAAERQIAGLLVGQNGLERRPLEPLEHHEGDARGAVAIEHPDVTGLHDGGRARREIGQQGPLLDELGEELLPVLLREVPEGLEHLERHGALPDDVHRLVDGGEAALADHALDGVFLGDRSTDEL